MKKKLLSLIMIASMLGSTSVYAQDFDGTGFSNVPITYQQNSTFTVVMPDSFELNSNKRCDFEMHLSEYDLIDGERVKITPVNNTITMENQIVEIPYLVNENATFYQGLPEFPAYDTFYDSYTAKTYYYIYENYILTEENDTYRLYCLEKGNSTPKVALKRYVEKDIDRFKITTSSFNADNFANIYGDREGTTILSSTRTYDLKLWVYDRNSNSWINENVNSSDIPDTETIIQSTVPIYDGEETFIQYSKEVKDPVDVTIIMNSNYMSDSTPITGTVDGSNLSSGYWEGEVVFEITLE